MVDSKLRLKNIGNNDIPKYKKIFNAFKESIETNAFKPGDSIPSINEFSKDYNLSRDTVFKAYTLLKQKGFIKSTPNKGYYIADSKIKVLLLISTFKAYKEVLYHSFMQNLPSNVIVDFQFHHYNVKNFKSMLDTEEGEYYKYIIMGFDHPEVKRAISKINRDRLLLIDWDLGSEKTKNYLLQDFGQGFYNCLEQGLHLFRKYKEINFIYPEYTYHPWESVEYFKKFCNAYNIKCSVTKNSRDLKVEKHTAYITVNDRMLYNLLDQCITEDLELGKDVGLLSYNETPIKRFIYKGISVVSIDFKEFGAIAAEFVKSDKIIRKFLPTKLIVRDSL
ncbi:GntR family transcriptional regulator [Hyunsoonleella pacifica]|uniref:GntR family transcriptional regulator n=1 Tax=Hyunsoonleella pacifica TaxID=1080224 RepID=A0A4V2JAL6_9FLAO|nr:GntR family transcriptional regulator [Hyunsoonleella pacifica]TBN13096.1 GntR family transcriptional regulator [Hyunsoonleella pacifica]GGD27167.1 GntR family transcriptional regulator [Hyunsoonleella pacifica]